MSSCRSPATLGVASYQRQGIAPKNHPREGWSTRRGGSIHLAAVRQRGSFQIVVDPHACGWRGHLRSKVLVQKGALDAVRRAREYAVASGPAL